MYANRQRIVKPHGTFKLRCRSEGTASSMTLALLAVRWHNAAIKHEPIIKLESDDEDVAEDVADVAESSVSVIKRECDEDMTKSFISATKRKRSKGRNG
ncbi:hypothetical protein EAF04_003701 [Stromatinia cepivora]|nr:hypothetical protein EAF04_003701 [Stromatinia cepivora]